MLRRSKPIPKSIESDPASLDTDALRIGFDLKNIEGDPKRIEADPFKVGGVLNSIEGLPPRYPFKPCNIKK